MKLFLPANITGSKSQEKSIKRKVHHLNKIKKNPDDMTNRILSSKVTLSLFRVL